MLHVKAVSSLYSQRRLRYHFRMACVLPLTVSVADSRDWFGSWRRSKSLVVSAAALLLGACGADAAATANAGPFNPPGASGGSAVSDAGLASTDAAWQPPPSLGGGPATGTGVPASGEKCGAVTQTAENKLQPVDIIFGVDTSGSMAEEVAEVQQNLNAFSQQIISSGIDVRVIMLATPQGAALLSGGVAVDGPCIGPPLGSGQCPNDSNPPRYVHIEQEVTSWDVLDVYINAYPKYAPHLREHSLKTFVTISDDNADPSTGPFAIVAQLGGLVPAIHSADAFIAAVDKLAPGSAMWSSWRYSGIYSFSICPSAELGAVGTVHQELVQRTQGVAGDLCLQEFAPVFNELARQVTAAVTLSCDWEIPAPQGGVFDRDKTNVRLTVNGAVDQLLKVPEASKCGSVEGWHYDDEANPGHVVVCPVTCRRIQAAKAAQVDLQFGCQTLVLL
jgi:hypothetical protein